MAKFEYLMIKWTYSPFFKKIIVESAQEKQKEVPKGSDADFLTILNEYGKQGWKIDKTIQFGDGGNFLIMAILSRPIDLD